MWRLGAFALGAWVGLAGALVHRQSVVVGATAWPWGLAVVLVTTGVLARAVGTWRRLAAAWFLLGWATVLLAQQALPGGGYLVATDTLGWAFTVGGIVVIVGALVRFPRLAP